MLSYAVCIYFSPSFTCFYNAINRNRKSFAHAQSLFPIATIHSVPQQPEYENRKYNWTRFMSVPTPKECKQNIQRKAIDNCVSKKQVIYGENANIFIIYLTDRRYSSPTLSRSLLMKSVHLLFLNSHYFKERFTFYARPCRQRSKTNPGRKKVVLIKFLRRRFSQRRPHAVFLVS